MTCRLMLALLGLWFAALPAAAQDWPGKPVKIIVPFGAGGPADVFARVVAQHLQESLKQTFVVENRPGAGSVIGTDNVAKSPPDGYTLLLMSNTHTTNESLIPNKPFQLMRDFAPISPINYSDLLMVVHPSVPAADLKEFIALAKAKPGQLNYASSGPGTPYHMAGELFKAMTGTDIVHVPHRSSGDMRNSVLGGHVQMMFDAITVMAQSVQAGQLKALGTTGKTRSSVLPNVPTIAEAGVPDYEATIWLGLMAPAGTPKPIIDKLNAVLQGVMDDPAIVKSWADTGVAAYPKEQRSPQAAQALLRSEIARWGQVVRENNIKA
jgi:tripartite-type tricarboxylate transporter receptor subunit TctC